MEKKNKIPAVFKEDLRQLLESLNELIPISNGERICKSCNGIVTINNIQLIIPGPENVFEYVCDEPSCVEEYNLRINQNE